MTLQARNKGSERALFFKVSLFFFVESSRPKNRQRIGAAETTRGASSLRFVVLAPGPLRSLQRLEHGSIECTAIHAAPRHAVPPQAPVLARFAPMSTLQAFRGSRSSREGIAGTTCFRAVTVRLDNEVLMGDTPMSTIARIEAKLAEMAQGQLQEVSPKSVPWQFNRMLGGRHPSTVGARAVLMCSWGE